MIPTIMGDMIFLSFHFIMRVIARSSQLKAQEDVAEVSSTISIRTIKKSRNRKADGGLGMERSGTCLLRGLRSCLQRFAVVNLNGTLFLFGGTDGTARQSDVYAFDTSTFHWRKVSQCSLQIPPITLRVAGTCRCSASDMSAANVRKEADV